MKIRMFDYSHHWLYRGGDGTDAVGLALHCYKKQIEIINFYTGVKFSAIKDRSSGGQQRQRL